MLKLSRDFSLPGMVNLATELTQFTREQLSRWLQMTGIHESNIGDSSHFNTWAMNIVKYLRSRSQLNNYLELIEREVNSEGKMPADTTPAPPQKEERVKVELKLPPNVLATFDNTVLNEEITRSDLLENLIKKSVKIPDELSDNGNVKSVKIKIRKSTAELLSQKCFDSDLSKSELISFLVQELL